MKEHSGDAISRRRNPHWVIVLAAGAIVATAIVTPMCFLGVVSGHDFQPHLASWIDAAGQWRQGIFFPRWAQWSNLGYGEPRFIFYPPASWLIGAALGSVFPWKIVPGIFVWVTLLLAGVCMWKFASEWLRPRQALVAAIIFAANPYHLAQVYYRSAFAELLASALFPLMLFGVCGLPTRGWRRLPPLTISFAGIWLSNAPAGVIATYSLVLLLVITCILGRTVRPLIIGAAAMLIGFGLAAFYVIPAAWEQRWVQINNAIATFYGPERNFLFSRVNDPEFLEFNWKISTVALALILFTALGIALTLKQGRKSGHACWTVLALAVVSIFLMLPPSAIFWRYLPQLRYLQFPWRWLFPLGLAFAFFTAAGPRGPWWRWLWWLATASMIATAGISIAADASWDTNDVTSLVADIAAGKGYEGVEGFQPLGVDVDQLDDESPLVGQVDEDSGDIDTPEDAKVEIVTWTAERRVVHIITRDSLTLALKVLNYPAWQVTINGQPVVAETHPQTGQIILHVDSGTYLVELQFQRTRDRTIGAAVSALSSLVFVGVLIILFPHRRRRIPK